MYRALFIFDYREHQWRMIEAMDALRQRIPDLNLVSNDRLARAWIRKHLHQYHFILMQGDYDEFLHQELDLQFLEDRYLHHQLYSMFYDALIPDSHPCFYATAHLRTSRTTVTLEYAMTT